MARAVKGDGVMEIELLKEILNNQQEIKGGLMWFGMMVGTGLIYLVWKSK